MGDQFFSEDPNQPNGNLNGSPNNPNAVPGQPGMNLNPATTGAPVAPVGMGAPIAPGNPAGVPGAFAAPGAPPTNPGFNPGVAAASLNASMGDQGHFNPGNPGGAAPMNYPSHNPGPAAAPGAPMGGPAPLGQGAFTPQNPQPLVNDRLYGEEIGTLDFGQKRPRWPINKFKGTVGKVQRIGVLSLEKGDWFALPEHYVPQLRTYAYCFKGGCCALGSPRVMYVVPVVTYLDLDNNGNVISDRISFEFMSLAESKYNDLIGISKWAPLTDIDLFVSCENDQYQEIKFNIVGANGAASRAVWKSNPQFQQAVWNEFQRVKVWMLQANARILGSTKAEAEIAFQKLMSQPIQGGPGGPAAAGGGFRPPTSNFNPTSWNR